MRKSQPLLMEADARLGLGEGGGGGSESYSSNSSFTESYSDSSDLANWEEYVQADGTLFYMEYLPQLGKHGDAHEKRIEFSRSSSLRLGKKAARRQQAGKAANGAQPQPGHEFRFSCLKAHDNYKQLELVITAADRFRFGRRSTAVESILGFRVVPFPDQLECLMVDGFVHDMPAMQQNEELAVKRGDWFKSLNDIEVRASNVDELLLQFVEPTKVCLKFVGPNEAAEAKADSAQVELKKIENFPQFSEVFRKLLLPGEAVDSVDGALTSFGLLILPPECYQNDEHKDSLYYYPEDTQRNFLYKARGSFLTLNAVLTEELQTKPLVSKLLVEDVQFYVNYRTFNGFLVLFAYSAEYLTMSESSLRADELISYMRFAFPALSLDNFANANANSAELRRFLRNFCDIQRARLLAAHRKQPCLFEELLKEARFMPLPKEAQLRIFDALSEMEAMDYRNWNDEPLNTHREFFIYGSALYYDAFLLASQLPVEIRISVEMFLRCRGLCVFLEEQCVKELYIWEEIVLPNATGRYFLTICSRNHLLLAVILKIFDAPELSPEASVPPSLFYIEEIQETLDHLIQCGIESLATFWSVSNKRPVVLDKIDAAVEEKDTRKLESFIKQKLTPSGSGAQSQRSINYDEDNPMCSSLGGSSVHSLTPSEEDSHKHRLMAAADDSDSGSDWEHFTEQNPLHYGADPEAQAQMTESLWKEINNVIPVKISAGWKNAVFYYVYVDNANGSVFCPLKANSEQFPFLRELRNACHLIHNVLQNTKNFRRLLAKETTKVAISKGMFAIKEHGLTVQVREPAESGASGAVKGSFVVVGRLFLSPAKVVYVCHRPDVPQNMVEMAFRLSFFSVG